MRILQLVSDWKWTGPAEPMLVLSRALQARGHHVDLVCPETPPGATRSLWREAELRGLPPVEAIEPLRSALRPGDGIRVHRLRRWLEGALLGGPYDIVQCWHSRDHVLAARALSLGLRGRGPRPAGTRLLRFLSAAEPVRAWPWNRWLFGPACDGLVCVSEASARGNARLRGGRPVMATTGAVALAVADGPSAPEAAARRARVRRSLGVPPEAVLVGVVARMQAHRRFDLLLAALARLEREVPALRLVLIGRGTRAAQVVHAPARAAGLESRIVHAGYRIDDYAELLGAMDLMTYLVPGSDGTCRALLEGAALGLPLVGTRRGAIPEIVSNGQTGLLVDETPESLAGAWRTLAADPGRRRAMGEAARRDARVRFAPDRFAARMEAFYGRVLAEGGASSRSAAEDAADGAAESPGGAASSSSPCMPTSSR